ncbi:MAG: hypothetical protein JO001_22165 [Alphaproteobacteria bacterium]|nr:hypothetical protein [Alphaproteobacteria bacterium]
MALETALVQLAVTSEIAAPFYSELTLRVNPHCAVRNRRSDAAVVEVAEAL